MFSYAGGVVCVVSLATMDGCSVGVWGRIVV